ncbi:MAG: oxidoreductase, partial [Propionibacteriales bacterium]|nr:oxidoreductase [Propionibacteriales bacterium]
MPDPADDFAVWASLEGVPSALAATRDGIDALLRDRGLRRTTAELTAESLLRGAVASARLDGSRATAEELRAGSDPVAAAAVRLNGQLLSLVPVIGRSPMQALARMHSLAAPQDAPSDEVGRPRGAPGVAARL